jgi:hypothetical protein
MHLAYLPYWLDRKYAEIVKMTFPNKLATYVAARVPVLYHGPQDSSPTRFLQRFPVGLNCGSLETTDLAAAIERLVSDPAFRSDAMRFCDQAYEQELSDAVFRQRFAEFVGIDSRWLRCAQGSE